MSEKLNTSGEQSNDLNINSVTSKEGAELLRQGESIWISTNSGIESKKYRVFEDFAGLKRGKPISQLLIKTKTGKTICICSPNVFYSNYFSGSLYDSFSKFDEAELLIIDTSGVIKNRTLDELPEIKEGYNFASKTTQYGEVTEIVGIGRGGRSSGKTQGSSTIYTDYIAAMKLKGHNVGTIDSDGNLRIKPGNIRIPDLSNLDS